MYSTKDSAVSGIETFTSGLGIQTHDLDLIKVKFLDGNIPVTPEVMEFATALRNKCPQYRFGVTRGCRQDIHPFTIYTEVWVYRTGDEYALGRIGFCSPNPSRGRYASSNDPRYSVYSRTIANEMYSSHSGWSHHAVTTKDLKIAMRNAMKYLKIFSPHEYAEITVNTFTARATEPQSNAMYLHNKAYSNVRTYTEELVKSLLEAVKGGYQITNSSLSEAVAEYAEAERVYKESANRAVHGYYVRMYDDAGSQRATVIACNNLQKRMSSASVEGQVNSILVADLPEDIMGKLSVLAMLDNDGYVESVGMKVSPNMFWIERDEVRQDETL
jgi:hypothetical protein